MRRTGILICSGLLAAAVVVYLFMFKESPPKSIATGARVVPGPQIAFLKWTPEKLQPLVFSLDVVQGTPTQLTQSGSASWLVWSPNGQYLALVIDRGLY